MILIKKQLFAYIINFKKKSESKNHEEVFLHECAGPDGRPHPDKLWQ